MSIKAGKENERKWEEYWQGLRAKGEFLPVKPNGEVNVAKVGRDSKVGRENLYKNPNIYPKLLEAITQTLEVQKDKAETGGPLASDYKPRDVSQKRIETLERLNSQLEEKNAVLTAENHELRKLNKALEGKLAQYEIIENVMIETGRRVLPF